MPLDPDNDPSEAYEVVPMKEQPHGPKGWWSVLCNGIPVHHFGPEHRADAERYAADPEYRKSLIQTSVPPLISGRTHMPELIDESAIDAVGGAIIRSINRAHVLQHLSQDDKYRLAGEVTHAAIEALELLEIKKTMPPIPGA